MNTELNTEQVNVNAVAKAINGLNEEQILMLELYFTKGQKSAVDAAIGRMKAAAIKREQNKAERIAKGFDIKSCLNGDKLHLAKHGDPLAAGYKLDDAASWAGKPAGERSKGETLGKNGAPARHCHCWLTWNGKTHKGKPILETLSDDAVLEVLLAANITDGMTDEAMDNLKITIRKHIVSTKCGVYRRIKDFASAWEGDNADGRTIEGLELIGDAKTSGMTAGQITKYSAK